MPPNDSENDTVANSGVYVPASTTSSSSAVVAGAAPAAIQSSAKKVEKPTEESVSDLMDVDSNAEDGQGGGNEGDDNREDDQMNVSETAKVPITCLTESDKNALNSSTGTDADLIKTIMDKENEENKSEGNNLNDTFGFDNDSEILELAIEVESQHKKGAVTENAVTVKAAVAQKAGVLEKVAVPEKVVVPKKAAVPEKEVAAPKKAAVPEKVVVTAKADVPTKAVVTAKVDVIDKVASGSKTAFKGKAISKPNSGK